MIYKWHNNGHRDRDRHKQRKFPIINIHIRICMCVLVCKIHFFVRQFISFAFKAF
jgi:hypothetical protein